MATITMEALLEAMEKEELSANDTGWYIEIGGYNEYPEMFAAMLNREVNPSEIQACAVGEASLQLAKLALCPDIVESRNWNDLVQTLTKCVEGTTEDFWNTVDTFHVEATKAGLTRAEHIRDLWENRNEGAYDYARDKYSERH